MSDGTEEPKRKGAYRRRREEDLNEDLRRRRNEHLGKIASLVDQGMSQFFADRGQGRPSISKHLIFRCSEPQRKFEARVVKAEPVTLRASQSLDMSPSGLLSIRIAVAKAERDGLVKRAGKQPIAESSITTVSS